eukprot:CAMPEP_0116120352 /NCGR_PEP_ID=MMETSP0329-20121206/3130_1 /TAXON_ID=697910 /ORGANISM="Pseudo-nitzschia arenysensis, Strain B593" /LENGTH=242 /DNA_ID=CAMNT_0003614117 /DNA_START=40 /DNA_END=768 /DNA_ORIENTATION=+
MSSTSNESSSSNRTSCDGYVQAGLTGNKTIQFLLGNLVRMGCTPPEGFIQCMNCEGKPVSGGFGMLQEESLLGNGQASTSTTNDSSSKKPDCTKPTQVLLDQFQRDKEGTSKLTLRPEIYLCEENVTGPNHANTILIHELIHAIDLCRAKMDPLRNCMQLACTEIRAENLSGECNLKWEFMRGKVNTATNVFGHGKECARRRAIDSVQANPNCTERAALYVDAAMERCYADTFPFERHPNQR